MKIIMLGSVMYAEKELILRDDDNKPGVQKR